MYYKQKAQDGEDEKFVEVTPNEERWYQWRGTATEWRIATDPIAREMILKGNWQGGFLPCYDRVTINEQDVFCCTGLFLPSGVYLRANCLGVCNSCRIVSLGEFENGCFDIIIEKNVYKNGVPVTERDESCVMLATGQFVSDKGFDSHEHLKRVVGKMYNLAGEKGVPSTKDLAELSMSLLSPRVSKTDAENIIDNTVSYLYNYAYNASHATAEVFRDQDELRKSLAEAETFADIFEVAFKQKVQEEKTAEVEKLLDENLVESKVASEKISYVTKSFKKLTAMKNQ